MWLEEQALLLPHGDALYLMGGVEKRRGSKFFLTAAKNIEWQISAGETSGRWEGVAVLEFRFRKAGATVLVAGTQEKIDNARHSVEGRGY